MDTLVGSANVSLVKSINKTVFTFGETVTYCFAWSNTGTASVDVAIYDTLPSVLHYLSSDTPPTSVTGNYLLWNLGTKAANTSGSVCVYANIIAYPSLPDGPWKLFDPRHWQDVLAYLDPGGGMPAKTLARSLVLAAGLLEPGLALASGVDFARHLHRAGLPSGRSDGDGVLQPAGARLADLRLRHRPVHGHQRRQQRHVEARRI